MDQAEIAFDKYAIKGAYHWRELNGPVHRRNAYTIARYESVMLALKDNDMTNASRVLDVGCGDGALTGLIRKKLSATVVGIDTTALSIDLARKEFARRRMIGEFAVIDGYVYPFADAAFDAVVCSDVIEHVQDPAALLNEMWRVLAPEGVLVVTTPVRFTEHPLDPMHVYEWFPDKFKADCEDVLGAPAEIRLSHPVAWAELYAWPAPILGRCARLAINVAAMFGRNVFSSMGRFRAPSTQTLIARKPAEATRSET